MTKTYTTADVVAELGCAASTVTRAAARLGYTRQGRDWLFTAGQLKALSREISPGTPGNPQFGTSEAAQRGVEGKRAKSGERRAKSRKKAEGGERRAKGQKKKRKS